MKELIYHRYLLPTVERLAAKPASFDGSVTATFEQHLERTCRLADGMRRELGVGKGDRYAVMALNSPTYLELYHSALLSGSVINPLNLRLAPKELSFILRDSGAKVCFADAFFAPLIDQVRAEAGLEKLVLIGGALGADVPHDDTYEEVLAAGENVVPPEPDEDHVSIIMYTGGTTGLPKGAMLDNRALMLDLYKVAICLGMAEASVYLHQAPMFHVASLHAVLAIPARGGQTTYLPMFDAAKVLEAIEDNAVTITVMVPTMIAMMLDHPEFKPERLSSLEVLAYGASPMPTALAERLMSALPGVDLYQGYGMTENCGLLTLLGPDEHRRGGELLASAGKAIPGSVVTIQDAEGNMLPRGSTGEVCARAGNYMRGYWNRPGETDAVFRDSWYHTGDAGYLDESGYLYLVDRVKDMIVTGGENVYSAEVENAIAGHPGVAQVAVIGIPSRQWGEEVLAIVVSKPGQNLTEETIKEWARARIARYKVPKHVHFRQEPLPLSGAMKVMKRELRAPYWEGQERSVR